MVLPDRTILPVRRQPCISAPPPVNGTQNFPAWLCAGVSAICIRPHLFWPVRNFATIFGKNSTLPKSQDASVHMRSMELLYRTASAYAIAAILDDRTVGETKEGEIIWRAAASGAEVVG